MKIHDSKETLLVTNADLSRSSFTDVNLHEAQFTDVNLSKAKFADINLSGVTFSSSARFQLGSTLAQPLAAVPSSTRFSIQGGFWIWPSPAFFAPTKVGTNFIVSFQTTPGNTYIVQYTASLSPQNWQSLPSVAGNGAVESVTNSAPASRNGFTGSSSSDG